jgi:hypothetical protein
MRIRNPAFQSVGCPVDLVSQISCEMCQPGKEVEHAGGYDEKYNQVGPGLGFFSMYFYNLLLKLSWFESTFLSEGSKILKYHTSQKVKS